jgi:hypothetical protein
MTELSCPRCRLTVQAGRRGEIEHCPRCLARTGGTTSVSLVASGASTQAPLAAAIFGFLRTRTRAVWRVRDLVPRH